MAAVDIICPHCGNKQKVAEQRLQATTFCLHCRELITDVYLYKVQSDPILSASMKGKLITDFGTTDLDKVKAKSDTYSGKAVPKSASDFQALHETSQKLESSLYYRPQKSQKRSPTRIYITIIATFLVLASVIGIVAWHTFGRGGDEDIKIHGDGRIRTRFHPNGELEARWEVRREDGRELRHGSYNEWHNNGQLSVEGRYENDLRVGKWREWHRNSQLASELNWEEGKPVGEYRRWHVNGRQALEGQYVNGQEDGVWREWHTNDNVLSALRRYDNGRAIGEWYTWHPNTTTRSAGRFENGERSGRWVEYHDNGVLKSFEHYVRGLRHGPMASFFRDERKEVEGHWKDDMRHDVWRAYHITGRLASEGKYVENLKHGEWKEWFSTGQLQYIQQWDNGRRVGEWLEYDNSGDLIAKREYTGDVLERETLMFRGEIVRRRFEARPDGSLAAEWTALTELDEDGEEVKHGWWREFADDGSVRVIGAYVRGAKDGPWRTLDSVGNLLEEARYENGSRRD